MNFWWIWAIVSIILGSVAAQYWQKLFLIQEGRRVRALWRGVVSFYGKVVLQFGGIGIALFLIPWDNFSIPQTVALVATIVFGFIIARFENVIEALTNISLVRLGQTLEKDGVVFTVTNKNWNRVIGMTPNGEEVSFPHTSLYNGMLINWTSRPFARTIFDVHIDDTKAGVPEVYAAIDTILLNEDGTPNPKYSVLIEDLTAEDSAVDNTPHIAWRSYAGELGDSTLYKVAIFSRYRGDLPGLTLQAQEDIWFALREAGISTGQTTHIYIVNNEK